LQHLMSELPLTPCPSYFVQQPGVYGGGTLIMVRPKSSPSPSPASLASDLSSAFAFRTYPAHRCSHSSMPAVGLASRPRTQWQDRPRAHPTHGGSLPRAIAAHPHGPYRRPSRLHRRLVFGRAGSTRTATGFHRVQPRPSPPRRNALDHRLCGHLSNATPPARRSGSSGQAPSLFQLPSKGARHTRSRGRLLHLRPLTCGQRPAGAAVVSVARAVHW
jgi:hypothetical protein